MFVHIILCFKGRRSERISKRVLREIAVKNFHIIFAAFQTQPMNYMCLFDLLLYSAFLYSSLLVFGNAICIVILSIIFDYE